MGKTCAKEVVFPHLQTFVPCLGATFLPLEMCSGLGVTAVAHVGGLLVAVFQGLLRTAQASRIAPIWARTKKVFEPCCTTDEFKFFQTVAGKLPQCSGC